MSNRLRFRGKLVSEKQYKRKLRISELGRKRKKLQSPIKTKELEKKLNEIEQNDSNLSSDEDTTNILKDTHQVSVDEYKKFNVGNIKVKNVDEENCKNVNLQNADNQNVKIVNLKNADDRNVKNVNLKNTGDQNVKKVKNVDNQNVRNVNRKNADDQNVKNVNLKNIDDKNVNLKKVDVKNVYVKVENVNNDIDIPHNMSVDEVTIQDTDVNKVLNCAVSEIMHGRRIIEFAEIGKQLWCVVCKEALSLQYIENEARRGLGSILSVRCHKCQILNTIMTGKQHTSPDGRINRFNINSELVFGMLNAGIGWTHLNKILGCLNIPTISFSTFKRYEQEVRCVIQQQTEDDYLKSEGIKEEYAI